MKNINNIKSYSFNASMNNNISHFAYALESSKSVESIWADRFDYSYNTFLIRS